MINNFKVAEGDWEALAVTSGVSSYFTADERAELKKIFVLANLPGWTLGEIRDMVAEQMPEKAGRVDEIFRAVGDRYFERRAETLKQRAERMKGRVTRPVVIPKRSEVADEAPADEAVNEWDYA